MVSVVAFDAESVRGAEMLVSHSSLSFQHHIIPSPFPIHHVHLLFLFCLRGLWLWFFAHNYVCVLWKWPLPWLGDIICGNTCTSISTPALLRELCGSVPVFQAAILLQALLSIRMMDMVAWQCLLILASHDLVHFCLLCLFQSLACSEGADAFLAQSGWAPANPFSHDQREGTDTRKRGPCSLHISAIVPGKNSVSGFMCSFYQCIIFVSL